MGLRKRFMFLLFGFAIVTMFASCVCNKRQTAITWPSVSPRAAISTTAIEITGDKGETLKVVFDQKTGECKESIVNGIATHCEGFRLSDTYYCTPPDEKHPANTDINNDGKRDVYCGKVKFLTDGTDIQFEADSADKNKKCKKIGGRVICY